MATARVAAVSRSTDKLDLFVVGFDNVVYTQAWPVAPGGDWGPGWRQIPGRSLTVALPTISLKTEILFTGWTLTVEGAHFRPNATVEVSYSVGNTEDGPTTTAFGTDTVTVDAAGELFHKIDINLAGGRIDQGAVTVTDPVTGDKASARLT
ncbi:hypothetical protein GFY24_38925 [Nocardia sp. SYP-A9097]|uniref:hypothetical protein n=1 Tax=Nocardia sp. SYP-A9097 TaxID=2663237 RepID=UPI00129AEEDA|nr:hypothetical protein [Nocardia sp. SYP-A9097]MRH93324.1 hypothetical protein [Nocardia sp. SYP-A9097]